MKFKIFNVLLAAFCLTVISNQGYSQKLSKAEKKKLQIEKLQRAIVDSQQYQFVPQNSIPMGGRNQVLSDFSVKVSKTKIESYLPYFGVSQSADFASSNSSPFDFSSSDYTYSVTDNAKGGWDIIIAIKDSKDSKQMLFTILKNGTATLQVTNNNKQVMTFNGYIDIFYKAS